MSQILWLEIALKGGIGLALMLMPLTALRALGLHRPDFGFWPRLAGALLLGIAAAVVIFIELPNARGGLGPAGLIPINLCASAALIGALVMGVAAPTRRGRLSLVAGTILTLALAFLEISHF